MYVEKSQLSPTCLFLYNPKLNKDFMLPWCCLFSSLTHNYFAFDFLKSLDHLHREYYFILDLSVTLLLCFQYFFFLVIFDLISMHVLVLLSPGKEKLTT